MEPTAREGFKRPSPRGFSNGYRRRNRRTDYRETREEFIKALNSRFPSNSINPETSFDELFTVMPDPLARHNQLGISTDLEKILVKILHHPMNQNKN